MVAGVCRSSRDGCELYRLSRLLVNHGEVRLSLGWRGCLPREPAQPASQVCRLHADIVVLRAGV